ncbi:conjugal transfer nickase/helicase TraI [Klebsiella aerogenes]|nr:conjugal transfer nickase/helicase TraI [Klebsiella aerogenes]
MKNNTEQPVSTTSHPFRRISVIGDVIRGLERDRPGTEKTTLPDDPQFRRQEEAIQQVASERLQAVERDMVRDLNREKTLGGD